MQDAKQAIFDYCKKRGALAVGIASLEACERIAPPGHRPSDLFPRVKSVIAIGVGFYVLLAPGIVADLEDEEERR